MIFKKYLNNLKTVSYNFVFLYVESIHFGAFFPHNDVFL